MLPIRLELTPASIIWQQSLKRKFMERKGKLIHVFSCSPCFIIPCISSLLCHSQSPNKAITYAGFSPQEVLSYSRSSVSEPQHCCSFHVLPLLWEADLLVRGLPTATDSLCSALTQRCLLARVLF